MNHKHGMVGSPEYRTWTNMITRCTNRKCHAWENYGGRGIRVCYRWLEFSSFYLDMGERPEGMTLDRINNDGNYEKSNCRWASVVEQRRNSRRMKLITHEGETHSVTEWANIFGINRTTLEARLYKQKLPFDKAVCLCVAKMGTEHD